MHLAKVHQDIKDSIIAIERGNVSTKTDHYYETVITRLKQQINLAKVHEDIKDGSLIILCEITHRNFLLEYWKGSDEFMSCINRYRRWKRKMLGWYGFRTKWHFEGATRFLMSSKTFTKSSLLIQQRRFLFVSLAAGDKLYRGIYFHP